ncbi:unnamed protein product [Symbiodinium natans]|uniref:Uncharacterized protein n=1 Tax=Symbiodinium natans TaxID=878477 RepID=A0A812NWH8_9DINO|nr:unnamed protein product [Symbiodinium natans]
MPRLVGDAARVVDTGELTIDELAGNVATKNDRISIAHVKITEPTSEPWLTLHYDEWMCVLRGRLVLLHGDGESLEVLAGQTVFIEKGERFRPTFPDGATEYIPVCLPAFRPDRCIREEAESVVSTKLQELHGGNHGYQQQPVPDSDAPEVLYHMCQKSLWDEAKKAGAAYFPPTFEADGFTHATAVPSRLLDTANHFYQDVDGDWLCLCFRRSALRKLGIVTRDEQAKPVGAKDVDTNSKAFVWPHVFGGIPPQVVEGEFPMLRQGRVFAAIPGLTDVPARVFKLATASEAKQFAEMQQILSQLDAKDGFVHLSDARAVRTVAARFFGDCKDLILLEIDPERLPKPLTWLHGTMGDAEPDDARQSASSVLHYLRPDGCIHVYGQPVPYTAVTRTETVALGQDGHGHVFPAWL